MNYTYTYLYLHTYTYVSAGVWIGSNITFPHLLPGSYL